MKTISVTEFRKHFPDMLSAVEDGETIALTYGRKKEIVGYFLLEKPQKAKRKLGLLEGKIEVTFAPDFKMTTEQFLGLED